MLMHRENNFRLLLDYESHENLLIFGGKRGSKVVIRIGGMATISRLDDIRELKWKTLLATDERVHRGSA